LIQKLFAEATMTDFVLARKKGKALKFETQLLGLRGMLQIFWVPVVGFLVIVLRGTCLGKLLRSLEIRFPDGALD
jgi:hypothetical protein